MQSNYLPPLEPIGDFRSYVCGDVVIDETAAIASGVLLQADQGGKIIIGAGVCIGMGAVLHAQGGLLEIGAGANLGAGVLVYGSSKIGEGACIGASSSIVRAIIAKGAIVPPCSLISGLGEVEKEAIPAPTSLESPPSTNQFMQGGGFRSGNMTNIATSIIDNIPQNQNIIERSTTETYIHSNVTTTDDSLIANSVERTITETRIEVPAELLPEVIAEPSLASPENQTVAEVLIDEQIANIIDPTSSTLAIADSAQAKAYAQAQINRYIKRLYPNS
jgi:carbon dioxide concentrating mechanism protein CcmN